MGERENNAFLTLLAVEKRVSRIVKELLGHQSVKTTMIYTHVLNRGGGGVRSPIDLL